MSTAVHQRALAAHRRGMLGEAAALYRQVLESQPDDPEALHMLGIVSVQTGNPRAGVELIRRSLQLKPGQAGAHSSLGNALRELKCPAEALAHYEQALELNPQHAPALTNRGSALLDLGRPQEALASYEQALRLQPGNVNALSNRGNALMQLAQWEDAAASYNQALQLNPNLIPALAGHATALRQQRKFAAALQALDRHLRVEPSSATAHHDRGTVLFELQRPLEALASCDRALQLDSTSAETHHSRGSVLAELGRHSEAVESFARAVRINPDLPYALGGLFQLKLHSCDWSEWAEGVAQVTDGVQRGAKAIIPFALLSVSESPAAQLKCARTYVADTFPVRPSAGSTPAAATSRAPTPNSNRIRIAYLSADFRDHPVAQLLVGVLERHDRERFEVVAVSLRGQDNSTLAKRVKAAADTFLDVSQKSDAAVAESLRRMQVDIAVDLQGFTTGMRTGILAHRAAPVQVNYLGYPGTMGAEYIDYIIADERVIPAGAEVDYAERIVRLPNCCLPYDDRQPISQDTPSRAEAGLPLQGFVFCAFNNHYKITPAVFDVWMRLLLQTPGSVLWLRAASAAVVDNLRREAVNRGVAADRLVFAPRVAAIEDHLARHRLADLFLDTAPYNAHATAINALWAGLPVVTLEGTTFAGRVGASLLHAVGIPELIAPDLEGYERLALDIAHTPQRRAEIRARLTSGGRSGRPLSEYSLSEYPLFDTAQICRGLETAYHRMSERHRRGEPPADINITAME